VLIPWAVYLPSRVRELRTQMAERSVSTNNAMTKKIVYSHIAAQAVGQVTKGEGEKGRRKTTTTI
jgi:hypothetical protein